MAAPPEFPAKSADQSNPGVSSSKVTYTPAQEDALVRIAVEVGDEGSWDEVKERMVAEGFASRTARGYEHHFLVLQGRAHAQHVPLQGSLPPRPFSLKNDARLLALSELVQAEGLRRNLSKPRISWTRYGVLFAGHGAHDLAERLSNLKQLLKGGTKKPEYRKQLAAEKEVALKDVARLFPNLKPELKKEPKPLPSLPASVATAGRPTAALDTDKTTPTTPAQKPRPDFSTSASSFASAPFSLHFIRRTFLTTPSGATYPVYTSSAPSTPFFPSVFSVLASETAKVGFSDKAAGPARVSASTQTEDEELQAAPGRAAAEAFVQTDPSSSPSSRLSASLAAHVSLSASPSPAQPVPSSSTCSRSPTPSKKRPFPATEDVWTQGRRLLKRVKRALVDDDEEGKRGGEV
ncbi:hypothetical protein JCM8097_008398 [Rhodosporidiobolus ruineniae]